MESLIKQSGEYPTARRIQGQTWVSPGFAGRGFIFIRRSRGSKWRSEVSAIPGTAIGRSGHNYEFWALMSYVDVENISSQSY